METKKSYETDYGPKFGPNGRLRFKQTEERNKKYESFLNSHSLEWYFVNMLLIFLVVISFLGIVASVTTLMPDDVEHSLPIVISMPTIFLFLISFISFCIFLLLFIKRTDEERYKIIMRKLIKIILELNMTLKKLKKT